VRDASCKDFEHFRLWTREVFIQKFIRYESFQNSLITDLASKQSKYEKSPFPLPTSFQTETVQRPSCVNIVNKQQL